VLSAARKLIRVLAGRDLVQSNSMVCSCESKLPIDAQLVQAFGDVRSRCVALRELLAPDEAWRLIAQDAEAPLNEAMHRSYLLLAYQRGVLSKITGPIHRLLCDGPKLRPCLTLQYQQDLAERWLGEVEVTARHERFRRFFGKVVEVQVADWLVTQGWRIVGLEALGGSADVSAERHGNESWVADVKYIGQETSDLLPTVEALASGEAVFGSTTLYGAVNYLLFRVFESARGLTGSTSRKLCVVVIDALAWPSFEVPLLHSWVDWNNPAFVPTEEVAWNRFLDKQRSRDENLDADLRAAVGRLDGLLVMSMSAYEYSVQFQRWRPELVSGYTISG